MDRTATKIFWSVEDLGSEYRRIAAIGKKVVSTPQLADAHSNRVELLDPFGNVFGLIEVDGRDERGVRQRRAGQRLALQNVRETLDQLQQKDVEQKKIHRVIGWCAAIALVVVLALSWGMASRRTMALEPLPRLPVNAAATQ